MLNVFVGSCSRNFAAPYIPKNAGRPVTLCFPLHNTVLLSWLNVPQLATSLYLKSSPVHHLFYTLCKNHQVSYYSLPLLMQHTLFLLCQFLHCLLLVYMLVCNCLKQSEQHNITGTSQLRERERENAARNFQLQNASIRFADAYFFQI